MRFTPLWEISVPVPAVVVGPFVMGGGVLCLLYILYDFIRRLLRHRKGLGIWDRWDRENEEFVPETRRNVRNEYAVLALFGLGFLLSGYAILWLSTH